MTLDELWRPQAPLPAEVTPSEVTAELHGRLVRIATMLMLPFLALPLALGRPRSGRAPGLVLGLAVLVVFYELINVSEAAVEDEVIPPWLGLWAPFTILAGASLVAFLQAAFAPSTAGLPGRLGHPARRVLLHLARSMPARAHRT